MGSPSATTGSVRVAGPGGWPRPIRIITAVCSVVFAAGTAVHGYVIVNQDTMVHMMRLAGASAADAATDAPGFLAGLRIVGTLYLIGNALGVLALRGRAWVFWLALAVNATQAAGVVMVPPEMFTAAIDAYGPAGALPSVVTDGGAALLTPVLLVFLARHLIRRRRAAAPTAGVRAGRRR